MLFARSHVRRLRLSVVVQFLALGLGVVDTHAQVIPATPTIGGVPLKATLTFSDPTGTVRPTASIPVQVTLSLASGSANLATDASGNIIGLTAADITPFLISGQNASNLTGSYLTPYYSCPNFSYGTSACVGPSYSFTFNLNPPNFRAPTNFSLTAGGSVTDLLGTLTPTGGTAPAGTYTLPEAGIQINALSGSTPIAVFVVADTYIDGSPAFTRTVVSSTPVVPPGDLFCAAGINGPGNIYNPANSYCASGVVVPFGDLYCSAGSNGYGYIYDPTNSSCASGVVVPIGDLYCTAGSNGSGYFYDPTSSSCANGAIVPSGDSFCPAGANGPGGVYNPSAGDSCNSGLVSPFGALPPVLPASQFSAIASGQTYSRVSQVFSGTVTIRNIGSNTISGPLQVLFRELPASVTLVNASGSLYGWPYQTAPAVAGFAPGQAVIISVQFKNPSNAMIHFTPVVYYGSIY